MSVKKMRFAALFMACFLVLLALVWAVLDQDPDYVCGSWWYGLIMLSLALVYN